MRQRAVVYEEGWADPNEGIDEMHHGRLAELFGLCVIVLARTLYGLFTIIRPFAKGWDALFQNDFTHCLVDCAPFHIGIQPCFRSTTDLPKPTTAFPMGSLTEQ